MCTVLLGLNAVNIHTTSLDLCILLSSKFYTDHEFKKIWILNGLMITALQLKTQFLFEFFFLKKKTKRKFEKMIQNSVELSLIQFC